MTRTLAAPSASTVSLTSFLGQVSDKNGAELTKAQFTALTNVRNIALRSLKPRLGAIKVFSQTDTSGAKVYGMHTYVNDSLTDLYLKAANGIVYKSSGSSWSAIGAVTTFAAASTFFATLNTRKTGASASTSGTTDGSGHTATTIKKTSAGWTANAYVGQCLVINGETKRIVGNDTENIYVAERFDTAATSLGGLAFNVYPRQIEFFFANGTDFYKSDGTTLTRLDNTTFAGFSFKGVETHANRLWGWIGTRLSWSDLGIGEHFSRNSYHDFPTPIQRVKSFGQVLVIYEQRRVTVMFGDSPDKFFWSEVLTNVGTTAAKSVANYGDYQFFLSDEIGVCVLSTTALGSKDGTNEPLSVSKEIIQDDIASQSAADLTAACAEVHNGQYHLCVDNDWYVLDVYNSFEAPRDLAGRIQWIWYKDDRPDAQDANVLGHYGNKFVAGAQDNGQVYQIEVPATYSDDSTAIAWTIEKQDWLIGELGTYNKYTNLIVRQAIATGSYSESFFFVPGGSTYGSAVKTIDLFTETSPNHKIRITGNPSDKKNAGQTFSFKITGSGTIAVPEIEALNLLYKGGILK